MNLNLALLIGAVLSLVASTTSCVSAPSVRQFDPTACTVELSRRSITLPPGFIRDDKVREIEAGFAYVIWFKALPGEKLGLATLVRTRNPATGEHLFAGDRREVVVAISYEDQIGDAIAYIYADPGSSTDIWAYDPPSRTIRRKIWEPASGHLRSRACEAAYVASFAQEIVVLAEAKGRFTSKSELRALIDIGRLERTVTLKGWR